MLGGFTEQSDRFTVYVEGGKHGYIDSKGELLIPLEDDDADEYARSKFKVAQNGKWESYY